MEQLRRRSKLAAIFTVIFVVIFYCFVGWRTDHTILLSLIVGLMVIHKYGYRIVLALAGLITFTILYDAMTFLPNYEVNPVLIQELYDLEVQLFGVYDNGSLVSLCEWFGNRLNAFMSITCGVAYLLWVPGPAAFAIYLAWFDKPAVVGFVYTYLLTNIIGIFGYYLFPAAPPWYYLSHGPALDTTIIGSEGLFSEFDRLVGLSIFHDIYTKGANIFAAIPSLHAAYPLLGLIFSIRHNHKWFVIFFIYMALGTWIGAVYSQHHYVIDILLGILCAILAYVLMLQFMKTKLYDRFNQWYIRELSY